MENDKPDTPAPAADEATPGDPPRRRRSRRMIAAIVAACALLVLVAATALGAGPGKGGPPWAHGDGPPWADAKKLTKEEQAQFEKFRDCMADKGFKPPSDGHPGELDLDDAKLASIKSAHDACAKEAFPDGDKPQVLPGPGCGMHDGDRIEFSGRPGGPGDSIDLGD